MQTSATRRILWIVNHQTLLAAEVPILRSLGWEVFVPKIIPDDVSFRSTIVSFDYDATLSLPETALAVLNRQAFYQHPWAPTVESIINANFDAVVTDHLVLHDAALRGSEEIQGSPSSRACSDGSTRERYSEMPPRTRRPTLMAELSALADRFVFAQSYDNLAEVEDEPMRSRGTR